MRCSIYNSLIEVGKGDFFLVNPLYGSIVRLEPWLAKLYQEHDVSFFQKKHSDFFDCLKKKQLIVDSDLDEVAICVQRVKEHLNGNNGNLQITINPTLDCNLRCWYCYEEHRKGSFMRPEMVEAVVKYVERRIEEKKWTSIHLSFFGGEPLLGYRPVMLPILSAVNTICKDNGIHFSHSYTTNATLITSKRIEELKEISPNLHFQIPFDGNEEYHNQTKHFGNGRGCYAKVLENTRLLIRSNVHVAVRCNVTNRNVDSFIDLVDSLADLSEHKNFNFQIQKVWQETETAELKKGMQRLAQHIKDSNLQPGLNDEGYGYRRVHCYADYSQNFVINFDGNVFQCTARDFTKENRVGLLQPSGEVLFTDAYLRRREAQIKAECIMCQLLPICPLCSQRKAETTDSVCDLKENKQEQLWNLQLYFKIKQLENINK